MPQSPLSAVLTPTTPKVPNAPKTPNRKPPAPSTAPGAPKKKRISQGAIRARAPLPFTLTRALPSPKLVTSSVVQAVMADLRAYWDRLTNLNPYEMEANQILLTGLAKLANDAFVDGLKEQLQRPEPYVPEPDSAHDSDVSMDDASSDSDDFHSSSWELVDADDQDEKGAGSAAASAPVNQKGKEDKSSGSEAVTSSVVHE